MKKLLLLLTFPLGLMSFYTNPNPTPAYASIEIEQSALCYSQKPRRKTNRKQKVSFIAIIISNYSKNINERGAYKLAKLIVQESLKHNHDPLFVASLIKSESTFKSNVVSKAGAHGLMQILPSTARYVSKGSEKLNTSKLHDPKYNLNIGLSYLTYLQQNFDGNLEHVLVAYNWGPGNLKKALKSNGAISKQAKRYAQTVITDHNLWKSEFIAANRDEARALG